MKKCKRNKAFIGAIINAVGSIAGAIGKGVAAKKQRDADERAFQREQNKADYESAMQQAQAQMQSNADQSYVDEYKKNITFKNGGKVNTKYTDRISRDRKYACGGKKYACGGRKKAVDGAAIAEVANGVASGAAGFGELINGLVSKPKIQREVEQQAGYSVQAPKTFNNPNAEVQDNGTQPPMQPMAKYGKKKRVKRA